MDKTKEIIDRMIVALNASTYKDLAQKLGVSLSTVDNWKKRGGVPEKHILKCVQKSGFSEEWIIEGKGDKVVEQVNSNIDISKFDNRKNIEEIIELLPYAPSEFIVILKNKLHEFKRLTET